MSTLPLTQLIIIAIPSGRCASDAPRLSGITWPDIKAFHSFFVASWRRKVPASLSRRFTAGKRYHLDESRCQQAADKSCFYLKEIWRERDLTGGDLPYTAKTGGGPAGIPP